MQKQSLLIGGLVAAVALFAGVLWFTQPQPLGVNQVRVTLGDTSIVADIADNEATREQGLSGRASLTDGQGMLFVFQTDGTYAFWMKDMLIPLDMIWLSSDKKVVYIAENVPPQSYPASFVSGTPARYVLEVSSGWAGRHGVSVGSLASW